MKFFVHKTFVFFNVIFFVSYIRHILLFFIKPDAAPRPAAGPRLGRQPTLPAAPPRLPPGRDLRAAPPPMEALPVGGMLRKVAWRVAIPAVLEEVEGAPPPQPVAVLDLLVADSAAAGGERTVVMQLDRDGLAGLLQSIDQIQAAIASRVRAADGAASPAQQQQA